MFFKKSAPPLKPTFNLTFPARLNWFVDEGNDELDRWLAFANFMMSRTAPTLLDVSHQSPGSAERFIDESAPATLQRMCR
jgi:hypothetical protein